VTVDRDALSQENAPARKPRAQGESKRKRKGDTSLLEGKRLVNFVIAEEYLGITDRQRQNLIKKGTLKVKGKGSNRKITTDSLRDYLPPENPK
jgi:hypothetical protein